jgi:hypothetical protein
MLLTNFHHQSILPHQEDYHQVSYNFQAKKYHFQNHKALTYNIPLKYHKS